MIDQDTPRPICDEPPRFADLRSGKMVEQPHGIDWAAAAIWSSVLVLCVAFWFWFFACVLPAIWGVVVTISGAIC